MTKTSDHTVLLPTVLLKNTLLHLPGVTFNMGVPIDDAFILLEAFLREPELLSAKTKKSLEILRSRVNVSGSQNPSKKAITLSKDAKKGIEDLYSIFLTAVEKQPIFACLAADKDGEVCSKVSVISRLVNVQVLPDQCILGLKGEYKGYTLGDLDLAESFDVSTPKYSYAGEIWYEIQSPEAISPAAENMRLSETVISGIKNNLASAKKFTESYANLDKSTFRDLLSKLNPLAELLNIQLSDSTTGSNLLKLEKLISSLKSGQFTELLRACDIYVSVFPFAFSQEVNYLQVRDPVEQLLVTLQLIKFVSAVFEKYLNMDYVSDSWNRLGKLQNGNALRSKFIVNHFNGLKELLELTAKESKSVQTSRDGKSGKLFKASNGGVKTGNPSIRQKGNDEDDDGNTDLAHITDFIANINNYEISDDGKTLLVKDYKRLKRMQSSSSEYQQLRNYLDFVLDLPWTKISSSEKNTDTEIDLLKAKEILSKEHFGMEAAKERILEHLAILKLTSRGVDTAKSPILLLNGPPGVGKTSLAKSISHSLGCEFQRISLGGIYDFADLKGHRRTYVGAIPGLIIQALRRAKSMSPVILLDEIDKIGMAGNKGNPEAALLEILDPEQNINFTDHYIGFPVDLSKVVFIATSNDKWDISEPLRDRMETIDLDGYNCKEKVKIAKEFILPRQLKRNGLSSEQIKIADEVFSSIANSYTHEAGIRNFERLISKICRKKAVELLNNKDKYTPLVSKDDLIKYLGVPYSFGSEEKFSSGNSLIQEEFGIVNGLSYNSDGSGSLLKFEMVGVPGTKRISCTGRLGEVLLESCEIAETLVEHLIHTHLILDYDMDKLTKRLDSTSVHMHVPEGGVRKDGPSAGITMTLCYLSLVLERPVSRNIAMTGEITLSAKTLPIGGLKEKLLGASLSGKITKVIVPRLNRKDLIAAYVESIQDRDEANLILTKLVLEEEQCLSNNKKRAGFSSDVELWVKNEYGVDVKYVDDFMDVIREAWEGEVTVLRKEMKAHL